MSSGELNPRRSVQPTQAHALTSAARWVLLGTLAASACNTVQPESAPLTVPVPAKAPVRPPSGTRAVSVLGVVLDRSASTTTSEKRCDELREQIASSLSSTSGHRDLAVLAYATSGPVAPYVIAEFDRVSDRDVAGTRVAAYESPTLAAERLRAARLQHRQVVVNGIIERCRKAPNSRSPLIATTQSALIALAHFCESRGGCSSVRLSLHSDLIDAVVFSKLAADGVARLSPAAREIPIVACGSRQTRGAGLSSVTAYEQAWKKLFGPQIEIIPTCPGSRGGA